MKTHNIAWFKIWISLQIPEIVERNWNAIVFVTYKLSFLLNTSCFYAKSKNNV